MQFMIDNDLTQIRIPLTKNIDKILLNYAEKKEEIDAELSQSLELHYKVIDSYDDIGNKAPMMLANNAIFIDCNYVNKDLYDIIYRFSLVLREHNYGLFVLARKKLNQILV